MSYLVFLALLSVASVMSKPTETIFLQVGPERGPILFNIFKDCADEIGVDSKTTQKVINWNFEDNDSVKKYIYCFVIKAGYADENGYLKKDNFSQLVGDHKSKDVFLNVIDECNKLHGSNKYETSFKVASCFRNKSPILFKL